MSARLTRMTQARTLAVSPYRPPQQRLPRLLAGIRYDQPVSLRDHERRSGPLPLRGHSGRERPERLIDMVERSGLTGRGGAGFPAGRKMRSVASRRGPAVVLANGAEGEPASGKDRLLLTRLPHLVMDGISLAAYAVGAREAILCVHRQETGLLASLRQAAAERHERRNRPRADRDSRDSRPVRVE